MANTVLSIAKQQVPANEKPVFMWSEELGNGAYCGPQYGEWDNEGSN